ncbi:bifunctional phosphopantothenoylcysteine decarboxylase/phosphopantothenate--cysteine ligase CoaBC [Candidatus Margulisiibacteriota bacterium]
MSLHNKTIIVGVTGGIAAYKTADLVSKLKQSGADVWVAITKEAAKLVTPLTFRTLSKNPVITDLFSEELSSIPVPHITITEKADLIVIAPATANIIGKAAQGIADDPLSTMLLACKAPKLIAPAMNKNMWENTIVQENISKLKTLGYQFIGPEVGWLACGDEGVGRMIEIPLILKKINELVQSSQNLKDVRVLVTAGGTREAIDPVRFITNRSSGKMGYAVAKAAVDRGASVTLITTPTQIVKPNGCRVIEVETARQMQEAVTVEYRRSDAVVMTAAVADYKPAKSSKSKIKKTTSKVKIELEKTSDILGTLGKKKGRRILIGFSLETDDLIRNSKKKLKTKNLDMIVANSPQAFELDSSRISLIYPGGKVSDLGKISKHDTASRIMDFVASKYGKMNRYVRGSHIKQSNAQAG